MTTEPRPTAAAIRQIEFELEKAEHGFAMPHDAGHAVAQHAAEGSSAETVGGVEGETGG